MGQVAGLSNYLFPGMKNICYKARMLFDLPYIKMFSLSRLLS